MWGVVTIPPGSQSILVSENKIEGIVFLLVGLEKMDDRFGSSTRLQTMDHQFSPAARIRSVTAGGTQVGHCREFSGCIDPEPGTAGGQISTCKDMRLVFPPMHCATGSGMILVPVGSDDQRVLRVLFTGNKEDTHGEIR